MYIKFPAPINGLLEKKKNVLTIRKSLALPFFKNNITKISSKEKEGCKESEDTTLGRLVPPVQRRSTLLTIRRHELAP